MANRPLRRGWSYEIGDVIVRGKFNVGATGAVGTIVPGVGNAIKSITRNSAGNYTIVFKDNFKDFHTAKAWIAFASAGAVMNPALQVKPWSYTPGAAGGATMVIQVVTLASPEVAADAPNGCQIHFEVYAKNSSV